VSRVLVVDVGTSSVRASVVRDDLTVASEHARETLPDSPAPGLVEFDPAATARTCLDLASAALEAAGPVDAVGVSNQRASTVVWDRSTGEPVGPGLGWQDLRTVGRCLALRAEGLRIAPNLAATKLEWLLDTFDPARRRDLCFGTVDSWVAWTLSDGTAHVTDGSNAALTGLVTTAAPATWDDGVLAALRVPRPALPRIVDSAGRCAEARALPGAPPIACLLGDQQASLVGQGCVRRGAAKITFGTGAMLDLTLGPGDAPFAERGPHGTFPVVAFRLDGVHTWAIEAVALAAGACVQWLRDGLGLVGSAADSHTVAAACADTGGVVFVPALVGLGTPAWDHGARGALFGLTRGSTRAHVVRAVLEGVAHRGADLVEAAEADAATAIDVVRVDGGMSDNPTFVQALADAAQRPVEISPVREATTRGAALMAGLAAGHHATLDDLEGTWAPRTRVEPARELDRDRWREAVERSRRWIPDLSNVDF
jgi:glycerol kinase